MKIILQQRGERDVNYMKELERSIIVGLRKPGFLLPNLCLHEGTGPISVCVCVCAVVGNLQDCLASKMLLHIPRRMG